MFVSSTVFGMTLPVPPWRERYRQRPAKEKAARKPLSRDAIVDAAVGVLGKEGIDAVTMRRVAQELETGAASLYVHVASKDELRDLLADRISGLIPLPEPDPAHWREQLVQLIRDSVGVYVAHPGLAQVSMSGLPTGENTLRVMEIVTTLLRMGGIEDQVVAWAADLLGMFVPATALEEEMFAAAGYTEDSMREFADQYADYLRSLPPDRFPTLVALAGNLTAGGDKERFAFKMDVIINGLLASKVKVQ
jgi:AcrR family transcriptional regulator